MQPDLVTFGKIIGGGLPVGAYAGRLELMKLVGADSGVFQGGTFAGNPLTMAAGCAMLDVLRKPGFYEHLDDLGKSLELALWEAFADAGLPYGVQRRGSLLSLLLLDPRRPIWNHQDAAHQDRRLFAALHRGLMEKGFLLAPSIDEPIFLSAAHDVRSLQRFAAAVADTIVELEQTDRLNSARRAPLPPA